jgi:hypothetical protein
VPRSLLAISALVLGLLATASSATAAPDLVTMPKPSFPAPVGAITQLPGAPFLVLGSSKPNAITDTRAWFARNAIVPDEWSVASGGDIPGARLPKALPRTFLGRPLQRAIRDRGVAILVYGPGDAARFVVGAQPKTGAVEWSYDLRSYAFAPTTPASERAFARQGVVWAQVRGDVLYVETAHSSFARSSGGRTAYVTAIDLKTSRVRWRSPALVANARTFVITRGVVVTGYGFTSEPDSLYLLDRDTGRGLGSLAVPSAPEYIALHRGRLFVRTYDHDLVVRLGQALPPAR